LDTLTYKKVNDTVINTLSPPGKIYYVILAIFALIFASGMSIWFYMILNGLGVAGIRHPVMWGVFITNFVFWVGIAHSGTLISAILYLFRAEWRMSIYRSAEAMTVFAVATAGMYPLIHLGRVWVAYWTFPFPNEMLLWPNFKSPLIMDVIAISTYLTVSATFFLVGLIPDIAAVRDSAVGLRKKIYTILSFGWHGTNDQWRHYGNTIGYIRSQCRLLGFCSIARSRLAQHNICTLLRCGRHSLRSCTSNYDFNTTKNNL
jgi:hypothetical protein